MRPGPTEHDFLASAALLGLSLLPIGFSLRLRWLSFGPLAWGSLLALLVWQRSHLGGAGDGMGSLATVLFLLAAAAAAGGQWFNLGRLCFGRLNEAVCWMARASIVLCFLLLLTYLGGGIGVGVALALLFTALADLALTALSLIIGAIAAARQAPATRASP